MWSCSGYYGDWARQAGGRYLSARSRGPRFGERGTERRAEHFPDGEKEALPK